MEERDIPSIAGLFKRILVFLKLDFYLISFQIRKYKDMMHQIEHITTWIQFFLFNILMLSIFHSMKVSLSENEILGKIRIFTGVFERNSFEYFVSFILGYILLYYIAKIIFEIINDDVTENDDKILQALLASSGSFPVLDVLYTFWLTILTYCDMKRIDKIADLSVLVIVVVYFVWVLYIYRLLDLEKKDKFVVLFSVILTLTIHSTAIVFLTVIHDRTFRDKIKNTVLEEVRYEDIYIENNTHDTIQKNIPVKYDRKQYRNTSIGIVDFDRNDYLDDKKVLQGISIAMINSYSDDLKFYDELSYTDRYRYSMLFIITTLMKENIKNTDLQEMLHQAINGNYEYVYTNLKNQRHLLVKGWFANISVQDASRALIELENLDVLKKKYEKEVLNDIQYSIEWMSIRDERNEVGYVGFVGEKVAQFSKIYLITRLIRFVPIL